METKKNILMVINILLFILSLAIYCLPNFIDRDINRILLSKLNLYIFYPSILICLIISFLNTKVLNKKKQILILFNYIILFLIILFLIRVIYVMTRYF